MSTHRLLLQVSPARLPTLSADDFLWASDGPGSSVDTTLGPRLEGLGPAPPLAVDFVRLAALVFFCDRTVARPRAFRRRFDLEIAVSQPNVWEGQGDRLAAILGLLTGDEWSFSWVKRREPRLRPAAATAAGDLSILFSGGADSACGAVIASRGGHHPVLVSHTDWSSITGQQNRTLLAFEAALGERPPNVRWRFARRSEQVGSGATFGNETSRRSRSMLFIALGVAVSATAGTELWIAENGFTSLNPPMGPESLGALSTRTTHPTFIAGLSEALQAVGLSVGLRNRFADQTKGEMFRAVSDAIGPAAARTLLSATHSCAKPQRERGFAPDTACGICIGCLVRRGAFAAAGLQDDTEYLEQALPAARRAAWLTPARRWAYEALQDRLEVGFSEEDVLDLGLPDDADLDAALDLLQRGLAELRLVQIP